MRDPINFFKMILAKRTQPTQEQSLTLLRYRRHTCYSISTDVFYRILVVAPAHPSNFAYSGSNPLVHGLPLRVRLRRDPMSTSRKVVKCLCLEPRTSTLKPNDYNATAQRGR